MSIQLWDLVNGLFEFFGSIATWLNVVRVLRDKQIKGINLWSMVFFTSWGIFNMGFYPHLHQWLSFAGGVSLLLANLVWLGLAWRYSRNEQ